MPSTVRPISTSCTVCSQRIVAEAHRAVNTIDDLLRLSQIESARTDDEVIELAGVVQSAIGRGRHADGGRGVHVMAIDPPEPIRVFADGRQLTSAIGNLVENAVKYSKDGGVVQVRSRVAGPWVGDHGGRPGNRYPRARPRPDLRALLPRRQGTQPRHGWHRPRPRHRAARGVQSRRRRAGVVRGGRGVDVRVPPAGVARRRERGRCRPERQGSEPTDAATEMSE